MTFKEKEITLPFPANQIITTHFIENESPELLILKADRTLCLFNTQTKTVNQIGVLPDHFSLEFLVVYSYQSYLVIVENIGCNGIVLNLKNPAFEKLLLRGDYHVQHCSYPHRLLLAK